MTVTTANRTVPREEFFSKKSGAPNATTTRENNREIEKSQDGTDMNRTRSVPHRGFFTREVDTTTTTSTSIDVVVVVVGLKESANYINLHSWFLASEVVR